MILNTIRYLPQSGGPWQAWRLAPGTGRFRNYQCLTAPPEALREVLAAVGYALTGRIDARIAEAQLQLADDAGDTWVVVRKAGAARVLRNGEPVEGGAGERALLCALLDLDADAAAALPSPTVLAHDILRDADREAPALRLRRHGGAEDPHDSLRGIVARQIEDIAAACAHALGQPALAEPQTMLRLARALEPLAAQYRELCDQYRELKGDGAQTPEQELAQAEQLAAEVELLARIEETAAPLLKPGVSLKALQSEQTRVDGEIQELCTACGIEDASAAGLTGDLRKPMEALARLEAYAKLIRASQGARKYCEQNIEPHYRRYLEQLETGLAGDRQITSELESCLATLSLRMRAQAPAGAPKTWFDRFKTKDEATQPESGDDDTARLSVEWALARVGELGATVEQARKGHEGALQRIDAAHEELVRSYGRLQEHWTAVAKAASLPQELDLAQMLTLVANHARLVALREHRQELATRIRSYQAKATKLESLVVEWRTLTGSQRTTDLSNLQILLQEAQGILRFQESKTKRLVQLRDTASDAKARLAVRALLKGRRRALLEAWSKACAALQLAPIDVNHEALPELFRRAGLVRALALVHGTAGTRRAAQRLFDAQRQGEKDGGESGLAATLYLWDEARTDNPLRLELLQHLEAAAGGELRLLLIADEALAAMLGSLGVGLATRLVAKPAPAEGTAAPRPQAPAESRAVIKTRAARPAPAPAAARGAPPLLNDRARQALEILSGPKK